ncbi:aminotransferase class IV [Legionella jordanis]|uniref:Aminodeoxychorismate lyase n=1 Tax=Legionella jordanis TaxID=456 RepID=A0A0W0VE09_9GAMM|nr:aminotransferase class IV [Legionella jordanis]KTD18357.1 aminodeoxychorismate lyase [Legionella jordanis]RMX05268.1 4-amino-4-deoxychorismate lyase [Legionella jordanis]RMX20881.1 4-amino-4-deoxychorismate lyase [Legionella jordanis]VEH13297.1 aminodeoxychorismate lyase [Legionella jordanis]HAT8713645.1 4-amino-4-deoxychorismate lyase [Legionella jordanis]
MTPLIFTNRNGQALIPMDDRILLGEGLFETLRIAHAKPCYPKLHWQRIKQAAQFLNIQFDVSFELWLAKLLECIQIHRLQHGGIKVTLSGGSAPRGLTQSSEQPRLIFDAFQYAKNAKALKLISAPWLRDSNNPIYRIKSMCYLEAVLARREAEKQGADDVVFFNLDKHATETSIANLFLIKQNQIFTPSLESGVLNGIIRQRLLALSKANAIAHFECELDKIHIEQADAIFICNSLQGIRNVESFNECCFRLDHPLINLMQDLLAKDSYA